MHHFIFPNPLNLLHDTDVFSTVQRLDRKRSLFGTAAGVASVLFATATFSMSNDEASAEANSIKEKKIIVNKPEGWQTYSRY